MFKHGEHPARIWNLELAVEIHLAIDRVDKAMQAFTSVCVGEISLDDELVFLCKAVEGDSESVADLRWIEIYAVEGDVVDALCDRVDEGARSTFRRKFQCCGGPEHVWACCEIE